MPIFEYKCGKGHLTEVAHDPDRKPSQVRCAHCHQPAMRVFQLRGVAFKGRDFTSSRP